jgi:hypothetical protein
MTKANRHAKTVEHINSSLLTRSEILAMERDAGILIEKGDASAQEILDALAHVAVRDRNIVFMDFCLGGVLRNRLDLDWKKWGNCTFEFQPGNDQLQTFNSIPEGALIILKKAQQIGETMRLYGHGRVSSVTYLPSSGNILHMDWSKEQKYEIEIPIMGCVNAVNVVEKNSLDKRELQEFWDWLRFENAFEVN